MKELRVETLIGRIRIVQFQESEQSPYCSFDGTDCRKVGNVSSCATFISNLTDVCDFVSIVVLMRY
jgi:hypothetical protein